MFEYCNNVLCVQASWLFDVGILNQEYYKKMCQRNQLERVTIGGNGRKALIKFATIRKDIKEKIIAIIGSASATTNLLFNYNGKAVQWKIRPFRASSLATSRAFEFNQVLYNGTTVHTTDDDGTPYRINNYTLGANHGYAKNVITIAAGHGKANVDVGSVWTDGTKQFVITNIVSANQLEVTSRNDNNYLTANSLTHVSGATNTAVIDATTKATSIQLFPVIKNMVRRMYIDGREVTPIEGATLTAQKDVTFSERYEIMTKTSIVEWLITQVGTATKIVDFQGESMVSVSNTFVFDKKMGCTQYQDFVGLKDNVPFQDIMFLQVYFTPALDAPVKYYIPKTLPIPYNSVNYDFTTPVNMTDFAFIGSEDNLNFTPAYTQPTGILADRVIKLQNSIGLAIGFIPTRAAGVTERRTNASRKALQLRGTKKIYMSAIDRADKTTLNKGDYFSAIGYRKFFELSADRTAYYTVETTEGTFVYLDWHTAKIDTIKLEPELQGKVMTIVEASPNVTVLTPQPSDTLVVEVTNASNYGYLVLKFV